MICRAVLFLHTMGLQLNKANINNYKIAILLSKLFQKIKHLNLSKFLILYLNLGLYKPKL